MAQAMRVPFRFQEHLDFVMAEDPMRDVTALLEKMRLLDANRQWGTTLMPKGCLLQLIGQVFQLYRSDIVALSRDKAERRMRLARTYVINSVKPVGQIAQLCGFADEAYFSRRFRKSHGLPPGRFCRLHQII